MITGKGRCNFTNVKPWNEFSGHIQPKANFLKPSFYNLTSEKMLEFMERHGLRSVVERGDRAFPESHLASDVVDALVRAAEAAGADYMGVGAVFPSPTKTNAIRITNEQLQEIVSAVSIPAVAIGGISYDNVLEIKGSKVSGVAVVSAIFGAEDIEAAAARMKEKAKAVRC
mgnify:CR=1 FL=1